MNAGSPFSNASFTMSITPPPTQRCLASGSGGFTLTELAVVIGIIGLLMAILLPVLAGSRQTARVVTCASNLHQLHVAYSTVRADSAVTRGTLANSVSTQNWVASLLPGTGDDARAFMCPSDEGDAEVTTGSGTGVGDVTLVTVLDTAPGSVLIGELESDTTAYLFQESSALALPSTLSVDADAPGTITVASGGGSIPAGTLVDSYLLHFDPKTGGKHTQITATLSFSGRVLGVMVKTNTLNATDSLVGAPGTVYPNLSNTSAYDLQWRGFEPNDDSIVLAPDGLTMDLDYATKNGAEQVRIITEPGAAAYSSYGMNNQVPTLAQDGQVLLTDYGNLVIDLDPTDADGSTDDDSHTRLRHNGKANVLYTDGSVRLVGNQDFYNPSKNHWKK